MRPGTDHQAAIQQDIAELKSKISSVQTGKMEEEKFKAYRLTRGVYGQRQLGVQMFRTKIPFGKLSFDQLLKLADLTDAYSNGNLHLTTRQNIQMHYVKLNNAPAVWEGLAEVGMSAREACGNTVRNLTASARAGIDPDEPFDVSPYVQASYEYFLRNPICQEMGRKIKPAFSSSEKDSAFTYFHDFGFIPRVQNGERGFKVVIGGGLGAQSIVAHSVYEFLPTDQIIPFMEACIRVFDRHGERSKRFKARMKFLIQKLGIDEFLKLVDEERKALPHQSFPIDGTPSPVALPEFKPDLKDITPLNSTKFEAWKRLNVFEQKQPGYLGVQLKVRLGDVSSHTARELVRIARPMAADDLRITVNQGLLLRYVPTDALPYLFNELSAIGLAEPGFDSIADVTACPGTDTCNLGVTNSTYLATELEKMVYREFSHMLDRKHLLIKISGCMNACGQHMAAPIGLHGSSIKHKQLVVPAMQVVLGGGVDPEGNGFIAERVIKLPTKRIPQAITTLLHTYEKEAEKGEYFNDYFHRKGKRYFYTLLKPFAALDTLNDEDYQDWGKDENFQPEVGVGECAGVAFDVIGGIFQDAKERWDEAESTLANKYYPESIYLSYSTFVIAAKALLLSKDVACNTHAGILKDFDTHYIETGEYKTPDESAFYSYVMRMNKQEPSADFARSYLKEAKAFMTQALEIRNQQLSGDQEKTVVKHHYQA